MVRTFSMDTCGESKCLLSHSFRHLHCYSHWNHHSVVTIAWHKNTKQTKCAMPFECRSFKTKHTLDYERFNNERMCVHLTVYILLPCAIGKRRIAAFGVYAHIQCIYTYRYNIECELRGNRATHNTRVRVYSV